MNTLNSPARYLACLPPATSRGLLRVFCLLRSTEMEEIWKDVVGYEQFFRVSNLGRVWSKRTNRLLKMQISQSGYKCFITRFGGRGSPPVGFFAHRLVAEAFVDNAQNKPFVNHIDGNKTNNAPENLEWVTNQENVLHAYKIGLAAAQKGDNNYGSKVTKDQANEIRRIYTEGKHTHRSLGKIYGLHHMNIGRIIRNTSYQ